MEKATYIWRKLTTKQREDLMAWRKRQGLPWHRPPHRASEKTRYHVIAACYEHVPHIGFRRDRIESFCLTLIDLLAKQGAQIHSWCILPNHYHLLIETGKILGVVADLGRLHGRTSFKWNGEENCRGRQVWCGVTERYLRTDAHFWATMNYIHHNPVRHGYVVRWQDGLFRALINFSLRKEAILLDRCGKNIRSLIMEMGGMIRNCESEHAKAWTPNRSSTL